MHRRGITGVLVLAALAFLGTGCGLSGFRSFGPAPRASIPTDRLFDLGVTDFDADGRLDLFTVNHKFPAAWLRNTRGRFEDVTAAVGAVPDPEFPGLEGLTAPEMGEPGLYLYMTDSSEGEPGLLHIRAVGIPAAGKVGFLSEGLRVRRARGARVRLGRNEQSVIVVRFDARAGATIVLDPSSVADVPMAAFIDQPADREQVKVGADAVSPDALDFRLTLHDRHAIGFADLVGGPDLDAFVVGGGLGGGISKPAFRGRIHDEMLSGGEGGFTEIAKGAGLDKGGCRGRQVEPVDVNGDGLLDLFESCAGHAPRIYRQIEPGRFGKVKAPATIGTADRWVRLGPDGGPSLISAGAGRIDVWRREGDWRKVQSVPGRASGDVTQIALGDIDEDGDLDVLAVAPTGNTLLRNDGGRLRSVRLGAAGVPAASAAASFVDYDNDGRTDLYTVPQGLIRSARGGTHVRTGLLTTPPAGAGIIAWADFDLDGLRDPVVAYGHGEFAPQMKLRRARNETPIHGHWLEADLIGGPGNRQAIGAWVEVRAGGLHRVQWVGQNDDAPHSQGHYRLYFGLGDHDHVDSVTVHWPDGSVTDLGPRPADQLLRLEQP